MLEKLDEDFGEYYIASHLDLPECVDCLIGTYHNFSDNLCKANPLATVETFVANCAFYYTDDSTDTVLCSVCEEGYGYVESENACVNVVNNCVRYSSLTDCDRC